MTRPLDTLAQRLRYARKLRGLTQDKLAELSGMKQGDISKLETGLIQSTTGILRLSIALDVPGRWLELGHGPAPTVNGHSSQDDPGEAGSDAPEAGATLRVPAKLVRWEALMTAESLPEQFTTFIPDDAVAPRARAGDEILCRTGIDPKPGAGVLIATSDGAHHLRIYGQGRTPGHWTAQALNSAYLSYDSEADGLRVIAVVRGVLKGWEE